MSSEVLVGIDVAQAHLDIALRPTGSRQCLTALVGVAPVHRDSGTLRDTHPVWGGRAQVRTPLDMRPLVAVRYKPVLQAFPERLRASGKAAKVLLTACRRKL